MLSGEIKVFLSVMLNVAAIQTYALIAVMMGFLASSTFN